MSNDDNNNGNVKLNKEQFSKYFKDLPEKDKLDEMALMVYSLFGKLNDYIKKEHSYEEFKTNMSLWLGEKETKFNNRVKLIKNICYISSPLITIIAYHIGKKQGWF